MTNEFETLLTEELMSLFYGGDKRIKRLFVEYVIELGHDRGYAVEFVEEILEDKELKESVVKGLAGLLNEDQ